MIDGSIFIFVWLTALLSATKKHALRSDKLSVCSEPTLLHRGDGVFGKWSCRSVPFIFDHVLTFLKWALKISVSEVSRSTSILPMFIYICFTCQATSCKNFHVLWLFERVKLMSDPAVRNTTGQVFFFLRSQYIDLTAFYNTTLSILVAAKSVETGVTTIVLIYRSSSC